MNDDQQQQNGGEQSIGAGVNRRDVMKAIGVTAVAGGIGTGVVSASNDDLCWEGHGADEHYSNVDGGHFVLTGNNDLEGEAKIENSTNGEKVPGEQAGGGAVHFDIDMEPMEEDEVCLTKFEGDVFRNAQLVLSDYTVAGYQVDLIYGDPIEEFDPDEGITYNGENRLLQAYWSGDGLEEQHFGQNDDEYAHCEGLEITTDINVEDGVATACIDSGSCDVSDFALVSYSAPSDGWDEDEAPYQRIYAQDLFGDDKGCFSVAVPPLKD